VGESWGTDAVTPLAYLAAKTSRVKLGTSIMQVGTRSPALIAMTAVSLAELSDDRFILRPRQQRTAGYRRLARRSLQPAAGAITRDGRRCADGVGAVSV